MNPDTAEIATLDPGPTGTLPRTRPAAGGISGSRRAPADHRPPVGARRPLVPAATASFPARRGRSLRLALDPQQLVAARDAWRAVWLSRLLIWPAGVAAAVIVGLKPRTSALDPPGLTSGLGRLADRLVAPGAHWDAAWYLLIARHGYGPGVGSGTSARAAFFPLYPLAVAALGGLGLPLVLAGIALSTGAFVVALYLLHRLATLEFSAPHRWAGRDVPRLAVLVAALFPMAFFFSAVYSESLYLALSVGVFLCARRGRWRMAAAVGGLAAATRNTGILLVLPIALLYLYGPRADRPPDRSAGAGRWGRLRPRYHLKGDLLWLGLVPAGLLVYMGWLAATGHDPLLPLHAQVTWHRHFAGPLASVWLGAVAAFDGLRQVLSMQTHHVFFTAGHGSPLIAAQHNLLAFAFLLAAVPAVIGVLRNLPAAYGAYVVCALALPLSSPVTYEPLMSLPRFLAVLFPLHMWAAARLAGRPSLRRPALALTSLLLLVFAVQYATWHWVA